jgi:hypothetical protein
MGKSSDPTVEQRVISDVASYGKQIGRIENALAVLVRHFSPKRALSGEEKRAIRELKRLLADVDDVKSRYASTAGQ